MGYLSAFLQAELATVGIDLQTPWRANMTDPRPPKVVQPLTRTRRLVETVMGQLAKQFYFESGRSLFVIPAYAGIQSFVEKNGYPPSRV